jgi:hypothetical protein
MPDSKSEVLHEIGRDQGRRIARMLEAEKSGGIEQPDVVAAAIALTVLTHLRFTADTRGPLTRRDIQQAIDGFMLTAQVEESFTPMGAVVFTRRA